MKTATKHVSFENKQMSKKRIIVSTQFGKNGF